MRLQLRQGRPASWAQGSSLATETLGNWAWALKDEIQPRTCSESWRRPLHLLVLQDLLCVGVLGVNVQWSSLSQYEGAHVPKSLLHSHPIPQIAYKDEQLPKTISLFLLKWIISDKDSIDVRQYYIVFFYDLLMMDLVLRLCPWYLSKGWGGGVESHVPKTWGWSYLQPNTQAPPPTKESKGQQMPSWNPPPPRKQRPANAIMVYFFSQRFSWLCTYFFGFPLPSIDLEEQLLASWSLLKLGRRLKGHIPSPKGDFFCLLNWSNRTDQKQQVTQTNNKLDFIRNPTSCARHPFFSIWKRAKFWTFQSPLMIPGLAIGTAPAVPAIYQCHLGGWMCIACWFQNVHFIVANNPLRNWCG